MSHILPNYAFLLFWSIFGLITENFLFGQKSDYLRKEHRNTQKICFSYQVWKGSNTPPFNHFANYIIKSLKEKLQNHKLMTSFFNSEKCLTVSPIMSISWNYGNLGYLDFHFGKHSDVYPIILGVPLSSILGPSLFPVYVNLSLSLHYILCWWNQLL